MVKIPDNAKKIFQGTVFSIWQYPQKMFDGSTKKFELVKRPNTIKILATQGKKIFIISEKQPQDDNFRWNFLGGRQDEGETILECAKRELLEEAGMVSDDWILWKTYPTGAKMDHAVYFYIAKNATKIAEQKLDLGGEKIELKTISFDDFVENIVEGELGRSDLRADVLYKKMKGTLGEFEDILFK